MIFTVKNKLLKALGKRPKGFFILGVFYLNAEVLTVKEVAGYLKLCEITIYRLAKAGKIPAFKVGGDWRFRRSSIERWIREGEVKNGKAHKLPKVLRKEGRV